MKIRVRKRLFSKKKTGENIDDNSNNFQAGGPIEADIEQDSRPKQGFSFGFLKRSGAGKKERRDNSNIAKNNKDALLDGQVASRSILERFAFEKLSNHLPKLEGYKEVYEQAGIPKVYESYLSSAILLSVIAAIPTFAVSLLLENLVLRTSVPVSILGSLILGLVGFAISFSLWLFYPIQRRNNFKSKLENQLPYSFGVLGVLAASGMSVDRLFEGISSSESNPVLAGLARRFLRNARVFGMDVDAALHEVARHSPSVAFSRMLESVSVAFKTTGSLHNLIMFESGRLFAEKRDRLKKSVGTLAVMAELYITLIVVGPIIFIVMLTIFLFLPSGGHSSLPDPTLLINILIFIGIPALSAMFVLILDSMVQKV